MLTCHHLLLNKKNLNKNLGFLIICPLFIFYIISIVIFFCKDFKFIKKIIDNIIDAKKTIKNKKNNKNKKTNEIVEVKEMNNIQQNNKKKIKEKKSKSSCIKIKKNPHIKKAENKKIKNQFYHIIIFI